MEFGWGEAGGILLQVAMGVSLAACAGLRAFLPLLVVGAFGRLGFVPLTGAFEWLSSWPALAVFGVAVVVELAADKFPVVDHLLDVVQVWVKPVAGVILVTGVLSELAPLQAVVLGIVLGGPTATAVHVLKAKTRIVSTAASAGVGNPVLSTVEDAGAVVGSVGAIFVPWLIFLILVLAVVLVALALRRRASRPAQIA